MTTAHQRDRETPEQRASLALNELGAAVDSIHAACELLGVTRTGSAYAKVGVTSPVPPTVAIADGYRPAVKAE